MERFCLDHLCVWGTMGLLKIGIMIMKVFFFIFLINCAFLKQTNFSHSKIDMQGHAVRMNSF